jgi:act minimal PKS acyl carrier protein
MNELSLSELITIIRECAGEEDGVDLGGAEVADVDFDVLGYDSLALMETAGRVKRQFGVDVPEADLAEIRTLGQFLAVVNQRLALAAG